MELKNIIRALLIPLFLLALIAIIILTTIFLILLATLIFEAVVLLLIYCGFMIIPCITVIGFIDW